MSIAPPAPPRPVLVLPTFNERENLESIVLEVLAVQPDFHLLVVDDASPDGTGAIADSLAASDTRVAVLHRASKDGLGRAYVAGFARALADPRQFTHMFQMDADFSHDPSVLGSLLQDCQTGGFGMTIGSRYAKGGATPDWPLRRRALSRCGGVYARWMLGLTVQDPTSGYTCISREVLESIDPSSLHSHGYGIQIELKFRCQNAGFAIGEVPICFRDRQQGRSKMQGGIVNEALRVVWKLRRELR